ncbi:hypothetical protein F8S12_39285 [Nostoc sp. WHI]|nr:hypothetical protein [Nostoc sp. WHI]
MERLKRMILASWLVEVQKELIKRDQNALLIDLENCHLYDKMTPQQAVDAVIKLQETEINTG